jgi:hypothetical protein
MPKFEIEIKFTYEGTEDEAIDVMAYIENAGAQRNAELDSAELVNTEDEE